jgi:sulfate adenylyltransferase
MLAGAALAAERARARTLPSLRVSSREKGDLIMLGIGGFTPLEGFMTRADWESVCDGYRTASGLFWPIPITLSADQAAADGIKTGAQIALVDADSGEFLATMRVSEKYRIDKAHECKSVFKTTDLEHPGVKLVMQQGEVNLAGPVKVLSDGGFKVKYGALFMTPAETRAEFERLGWSRVAAFQTRNPMHRSHEYLAKVAIETCDGVLVHSLLGALKPGDIPAEVRTRAIAELIAKYFRPARWCRPAIRSTCATPARARRCCTRCSGRITAARTRSSGATMPAWGATTGRLTRIASSTRSRATRSRRSR